MSPQPSFWERRKAAVAEEAQAERAAEEARIAVGETEATAEKDDAAILEELGLPDPDAMQPGDDFSAFMSSQVPEHLRRIALRKLWRSNPVLACVDGLNEYDDDYRAAMLMQGPVKTAYQVGKGMMAHIEEMERQKEEKEAALTASAEVDEETDAETLSEIEETAEEVATAKTVTPETPEPVLAESGEEDLVPRRMRFRFEEAGA